jgi:hypothetical protein
MRSNAKTFNTLLNFSPGHVPPFCACPALRRPPPKSCHNVFLQSLRSAGPCPVADRLWHFIVESTGFSQPLRHLALLIYRYVWGYGRPGGWGPEGRKPRTFGGFADAFADFANFRKKGEWVFLAWVGFCWWEALMWGMGLGVPGMIALRRSVLDVREWRDWWEVRVARGEAGKPSKQDGKLSKKEKAAREGEMMSADEVEEREHCERVLTELEEEKKRRKMTRIRFTKPAGEAAPAPAEEKESAPTAPTEALVNGSAEEPPALAPPEAPTSSPEEAPAEVPSAAPDSSVPKAADSSAPEATDSSAPKAADSSAPEAPDSSAPDTSAASLLGSRGSSPQKAPVVSPLEERGSSPQKAPVGAPQEAPDSPPPEAVASSASEAPESAPPETPAIAASEASDFSPIPGGTKFAPPKTVAAAAPGVPEASSLEAPDPPPPEAAAEAPAAVSPTKTPAAAEAPSPEPGELRDGVEDMQM